MATPSAAPWEVEAQPADQIELNLVRTGGDHRGRAGDDLAIGFRAGSETVVTEHLLARPCHLAFHRTRDGPRHSGKRSRPVRVANPFGDRHVVEGSRRLAPRVG